MPVLNDRGREDAIVAVAGALLLVTRKEQPSPDECREMAERIVDEIATHSVEIVKALREAEEEDRSK